MRQLAIEGLTALIESALANRILTKSEDDRIAEIRKSFDLGLGDLGEAGRKLTKAEILRDLEEGRVSNRVVLKGVSPINLERDEVVLWIFNETSYYTTRTHTKYVGSSHGMSFRVAKGMYYRVGAFKGEPIRTKYLSEEGKGDLIITNRNVYFFSPQKTIKLPAKKIISVQPFSDGIQLMRDAANAQPQLFKLNDPWFAANAIARLNLLQ